MLSNDLVKIYKHLHQYPELSSNEYETTNYIASILDSLSVEYKRLEGTGLVAYMRVSSDAICFRADIDGLAIKEETDCEYKSKNENTMHACGHDGHMTMLLGLIKKIVDEKIILKKTHIFIFQPSEEKDGGAQRVIASKLLDGFNIEHIFGLHVWPGLKEKVVGLKAGALMATNCTFKMEIGGVKAHAATPHLGVDASLVLTEVIQYFQKLISKKTSPFEPLIINIGKISGGAAANVVMDKILLDGTIRAISNQTLSDTLSSIEDKCRSMTVENNVKTTIIQTEVSYPVVFNTADVIDNISDNLNQKYNFEFIQEPSMASEDFGFYLNEYPGAFLFLGVGDKYASSLHNGKFIYDYNVLQTGVNILFDISKLYEGFNES